MHTVTLIPGDGIGPEVTGAACEVLEASGVHIAWDRQAAGLEAYEKYGDPLPADALASIRRTRVALKGPLTTPLSGEFRSANIGLRLTLDLYAQVRPCRLYPGVPSSYSDVDLVVIREATEDLYTGIELGRGTDLALDLGHWLDRRVGARISPDSAISLKLTSESATSRVFDFAFRYARDHGRRLVTAVHKATVMTATDGLFLDVARSKALQEQDIEYREEAVDALALHLVRRPAAYDVLVLPNLYGDIISDLAAGLIGGVGLAPGANYGDGIAVFEAAHGSAPKYAGKNRANPIGAILSGVMMLRYLKEERAADQVEQGVASVLASGEHLPRDVNPHGSSATTREVAEAVLEAMKAQ